MLHIIMFWFHVAKLGRGSGLYVSKFLLNLLNLYDSRIILSKFPDYIANFAPQQCDYDEDKGIKRFFIADNRFQQY